MKQPKRDFQLQKDDPRFAKVFKKNKVNTNKRTWIGRKNADVNVETQRQLTRKLLDMLRED